MLTRGRVVGGSAQVNQAGAVRGAQRDFDAWAMTARAPAWSWDRVLPAYCRLETPGAVGIGPYPHSHRDRVRQSTAVTHLMPARKRSNLTVRGGTTVDRIVIEAGRAVGVGG